MFEVIGRYSKPLFSVLALCLSLVSVYWHGKIDSPTPVKIFLSEATSPALELADGIVGGTRGVFTAYIALVDLQAENERLERENERLLGEFKKAKRLKLQNARLKKFVGFKEAHSEFELVAARVIARDISPHYRVVKISLDVGKSSDIRVGMPVVSHAGVVGRVASVKGDMCEVMLIVDSRSAMNVRIAGKGVTGTLTGAGVRNEYEARFRFLYKSKPVLEHDVVVTSGHDQVFPSGLEVGKIDSSESSQSGVYYLFKVTPSVNFSTLEEVFVLVGGNRGEESGEGKTQ